MVVLIIIKDLVEITSYYFVSRIILKSFKFFIIIVLYKEGGKMLFLNSYKLIIFKNILVKVLKKYIANIILKVAKKYRLFLWNQIRVRYK